MMTFVLRGMTFRNQQISLTESKVTICKGGKLVFDINPNDLGSMSEFRHEGWFQKDCDVCPSANRTLAIEMNCGSRGEDRPISSNESITLGERIKNGVIM